MRTSFPRIGCQVCSTKEPPTSLYNVLSERYGLVHGMGRGHDRGHGGLAVHGQAL